MQPSSSHDQSRAYQTHEHPVRPPASIPGTTNSSSSSSANSDNRPSGAGASSLSNRGAGMMSLIQQNMTGFVHQSASEERDPNTGFEFTRRKRWPQLLLQELVGSAQFCLIPTVLPASSLAGTAPSRNVNQKNRGWKMLYVSPGTGDLLGRTSTELEGRDFFELVFGPDQDQLHALFNSLIVASRPLVNHKSSTTTSSTDTPTSTSSNDSSGPRSDTDPSASHTIYVRLLQSESAQKSPTSGSSSRGRSGPKVWELRVHTTGVGDGTNISSDGELGLGPGPGVVGTGNGTVVPAASSRMSASVSSGSDDMKGAAIWVMGRKIHEVGGENEGNSKSLDAFLELKLENERLREELMELQSGVDYDVDPSLGLQKDPMRYLDNQSSESSTSSHASPSSSPSSPSSTTSNTRHRASDPSAQADRRKSKPKKLDRDYIGGGEREKKKSSSASNRDKKRRKDDFYGDVSGGVGGGIGGSGIPLGFGVAGATTAGVGGGKPGIGEDGLHVCVTCGRTDSPEWRKGPLGPKTLCNACGLRWAKRNSTQPSRKDKKTSTDKHKA